MDDGEWHYRRPPREVLIRQFRSAAIRSQALPPAWRRQLQCVVLLLLLLLVVVVVVLKSFSDAEEVKRRTSSGK